MAKPRRRSGQTSRAGRRRSGGQSLPGWVWGLSGLAVGLFVALLVHLQHLAGQERTSLDALFEQPAAASARANGPGPAGTGKATRDKPSFEFYRLLPEQEVAVPSPAPKSRRPEPAPEPASEPEPTPKPTPASAAPPDGGQAYLLQAGSFQDYDDADRMKASLALLGIEAHIQKVELTGGEIWHRVRIGPIADRNRINAIRARLVSNEIESILLKRGG